jgi:hypothetical protein
VQPLFTNLTFLNNNYVKRQLLRTAYGDGKPSVFLLFEMESLTCKMFGFCIRYGPNLLKDLNLACRYNLRFGGAAFIHQFDLFNP